MEGLAPQEYSLHINVILDGWEIDNYSVDVYWDLYTFSEYMTYYLSMYACDLEISATVLDRNGLEVNSTTVTLQGICAQPELEVEQFYPSWETPEFVCHEVAGDPTSDLQYVNFSLVNDGNQDCGDGSDEPFDMDLSTDSDGDGDPTNDQDSWFECNDGSSINMNMVNDGTEDCFFGEDEYSYSPWYWGDPRMQRATRWDGTNMR